MRVAWLHPHFQFWTGGTKFVFEVTRRLRKEVELTPFVLTADEKIKRLFEGEGLEVIPVSVTSTHSPLFWAFFPFWVKIDLLRLKDRLKDYDLLVSSMFPMNWIAYHIQKDHIQYCFEPFAFFHDQALINGFSFPKKPLLKILKFLYERWDVEATQEAKKVLTVNQGTSHWIEKVYGRKAVPTYLGVDTDFFCKMIDEELKKKYSGWKVILHSTDYTPLKRTELLIRSLIEIKKEVPNCKLLVTHTMEDRKGIQRIKQLIDRLGLSDRVEMLGFVEIEEFPFYYSLADVAVYPGIGSGASAASLFVLESMACETPVVRTSDSFEEVIDGESGFLFSPHDIKGMVKKIVHLLKDEGLRKRMGASARERIKKVYNWDSVKKIFLDEILACLG